MFYKIGLALLEPIFANIDIIKEERSTSVIAGSKHYYLKNKSDRRTKDRICGILSM